MKIIKVVITILFFPLSVFATAQCGDILIWEGDTVTVFPLAPLELQKDYESLLELREDYDSLVAQIWYELKREMKAIYPEKISSVFTSSACNRGYVAEWIILNDSIFLNNIYHCNYRKVKINLKNIFPNIKENQKIFASWINGDLSLPQGERIEYGDAFTSISEFETVLGVENGLLKNFEVFHNRIAKKSDFFEKATYREIFDFTHQNINWDILPDLTNKSIRVNLFVNLNEQGQIESINEKYTHLIESDLSEKDSGKFVLNSDINNVFIKESIRIAKLISEWDIIYQRGKIRGNVLCIDFSEKIRKEYDH